MFQGTTSRNAAQIADLMDTAGGHIGAFTARDYTCYYGTVLDENRTYGIELLSDVLLNSIFPPERLESEREAILNEIKSGYDIPSRLSNSLMKSSAWKNHALGRPIAGTEDKVKGFSREDIIYFVHQHYLPDRLTVAAAGNIGHEDFCALVRDGFWRMLGNSEYQTAPAPMHSGGVVCKQAPLHQAYFSLGLPAPAYANEHRFAVHILNTLLGGGMSSRLFQRIRKNRGLVYDIGSDYEAYTAGGMLVIEGCTVPDYLNQGAGAGTAGAAYDGIGHFSN